MCLWLRIPATQDVRATNKERRNHKAVVPLAGYEQERVYIRVPQRVLSRAMTARALTDLPFRLRMCYGGLWLGTRPALRDYPRGQRVT